VPRLIWDDRAMLLAIGLLVAFSAAVIIFAIRALSRLKAVELGKMSEQWLAEHRASGPR